MGAVNMEKATTMTIQPEKPNDFVLLKRIERDVAQLSEAGLAYLLAKLGVSAKPKEG
jgi:hypothetical protein